MIILLGSRAAKTWFPEFRKPKDWDAVASLETIMQWSEQCADQIKELVPKSARKMKCVLKDRTRIEFEILGADPSTTMLAEMASNFAPAPFPYGAALAATPSLLWLTKRSHLQWSIHWDKNIADMHWIKPRSGSPTDAELIYYNARLSEHKQRFTVTKANLDMSNAQFFDKSAKIGRVIDHDRLHELVAYNARPLFERFKPDLSKASLSRALFEAAPLQDRFNLVREEAMVIALERYLIPALPDVGDPVVAYQTALKRICTTLTSGWFRDFAIDQWGSIMTPDKDFVAPYLAELAAVAYFSFR